MEKLVKVCGMRLSDNIREIEGLGVDMMGFIFYPRSPRYVSVIPDYLPTGAKRVGVFVDESREHVLSVAKKYKLDYIQLHGVENPAFCGAIKGRGYGIIKAFPISFGGDLALTGDYAGICDYFLFDTKSLLPGGSGEKFDWNLIGLYNGDTPFLLSGGIGPDDAEELKRLSFPQLAGFDLNSRFETVPAVKDPQKIAAFIEKTKNR